MELSTAHEALAALLETLHASLGDGEKYRLEFERKGHALDLTVIPLLAGQDKDIPEEAKNVRAALALPLAIRGLGVDEAATAFASRLGGYATARQAVVSGFDELLQTLRDASAQAKNATQKAGKKGAKATATTKVVDKPSEADDGETCGAASDPADTESAAPGGDGILGF